MFNDAPLGGLASLLATIRGLYPNAQVTSGYRGPDNPLTKRNPASLHAQGSPEDPRAVDVAPIPGMTFDQYVASVKRAGVPIGQAFDEAKHPFPWTTGPNWHLASGDAKPMAAYYPQRKPRTLADQFNPAFDNFNSMAIPMPVDLPTHEQRFGTGYDPATGAMSLAGGQIQTDPILDSLKLKKNNLFSRKNVGSALGIIGDALMAYGGMQPQFGPGLRRQQELDQEHQYDLQKFNAELEARRQEAIAKAQEPPQAAQDAIWFSQQPPDVQAQILRGRDAMYPVTAFDPTRGTVRVPRSAGGVPPEAIQELRSAVAKGDTGAIAEFEQTFGQGSANQYLGGY